MHEKSIANCPKLNKIYFEEKLPEEIDGECYVGDGAVVLYVIKNGQPFCIGFLSDEHSIPIIKLMYDALNESINNGTFE